MFKRWEQHSPRWIREHSKKGESKTRWNRWFKLSPKSRKASNPAKYARGESVLQQRKDSLFSRTVRAMSDKIMFARRATIEAGIALMSPSEMLWTINADQMAIRGRARNTRNAVTHGGRNPWWYR